MTGLRDTTFIAVVAVALLAPVACLVVSPWRGVTPRSALEGRERPKLPEITLRVIARGEAQSAFDAILAFSAPNRDNALLVHAQWQRAMIRGAAGVFGFDALPTFYGSQLLLLRQRDHLAAISGKVSQRIEKRLRKAVGLYSEAVNAHPRIRWFFAGADVPHLSAAGPGRALVKRPVDYDWYRRHLLEKLPSSCKVIDLGYAPDDDVYGDFFRTDHHWRIQGAVRAYRRIAEALGIEPVVFGPPMPVTGEEFFGSYARRGLALPRRGEAVFDMPYESSPLRVEIQENRRVPDFWLDWGRTRLKYRKSFKYEDMYGKYFHSNMGCLRIVNERAPGGILLIVGDSFGHCMERFFAEHYREVYKLDPRFTDITLAAFLQNHHVDDALWLLRMEDAAHKAFLGFLRGAGSGGAGQSNAGK